ncbi:hypothetical protein [Emticicia sp. 17c]|uniref:hypothetical protein n=1 Tax=Emticicia sp. 17c TaxID=3127704 RepID=UPI00301BABD9
MSFGLEQIVEQGDQLFVRRNTGLKRIVEVDELTPLIPRITTAELRALNADSPKAEAYILTDDGKEGTYWKKRGVGLANEDNRGTVLVTTDLVVYEHKFTDGVINPKWFGALADGISDDSIPVKTALAMVNNGVKKVVFPSGTYKVGQGVQCTISNKDNFSIIMDDDATFLNTDYTDYLLADATFSGNIATITTSIAHGYSTGDLIAMKDFSDLAYNAATTITVASPNTFTYTLQRVPSGNSSGKVRRGDITRCLITLNNCKNVNVKISFKGTVQMSAVQSRLGWVLLKLQNSCSSINAHIKAQGCAYGVWSGNFEADEGNLTLANIKVEGHDIGYPVALWKSGDNSVFDVCAESVHRGVYATGVKNSTFNLLLKNYDITGILVAHHYIGTTMYGCENLTINAKDYGSDITVPVPRASYLVGFGGYYVDSPAEIRNIDINIQLNNAKCVTPIYMRTLSSQHKISNINIKGLVDRRTLLDTEIVNEFVIGGEDETGKSGTYSGINFISWRVLNPDGGTTKPLSIKLVSLLDDINFVDFKSSSPRSITLPAGRRISFPIRKIEGTDGDPNGLYTAPKGDFYVNTSINNLDRTIYLKTNSSGNLGWYALQPISFGPTSSRPSLSGLTRGFMYFDTDLGKPIWWSGVSWKDANGSTV